MRLVIGIIAIVFSSWLQAGDSFLTEAERASLTPHPDVKGTIRHLSPGVELGSYKQLLFGGLTLYYAESSKSKDIDPNELATISDSMKTALALAAQTGGLRVVMAPEANTALINIAITDVKLKNKKRGLFGYTPVGFAVSTAANAAGLRMELKDANIEGELVDSLTGEVLAVWRVDDIPMQKGEKVLHWEDISAVFEKLLAEGIVTSRK